MFNWLILGSMPGPWLPGDQAETGPYPSQAAPSRHSPNRKGNWHWIAQPADVHRSYAGLVSFTLPSRKGKTPKLPCNYWEPQEKSEKYSLWVESLMTTIQTIPGFCLLSYRRKEERKEVFKNLLVKVLKPLLLTKWFCKPSVALCSSPWAEGLVENVFPPSLFPIVSGIHY